MSRQGHGQPVSVAQLRAVAAAYLSGDENWQIVADHDEYGIDGPFTKTTLHNRLQQIRERTGIRSNVSACQAMLKADPTLYVIERPDPTPMIERRLALKQAGWNLRQIAAFEGVSPWAISLHFRRYPPS